MGFLYLDIQKEAAKAAPRKRQTNIPIHSIKQMGCKACPRDKEAGKLCHPKMEETGSTRHPDVLFVWDSPTLDDDHVGQYGSTEAGRLVSSIARRLGFSFAQTGVVQCGSDEAPSMVEVTACRARLEGVVSRLKPRVVVALGEMAWSALSGLGGSITFRGLKKPVTIGGHTTWAFCIGYPKFLENKKSRKVTPYELAFRMDLEEVQGLLDSGEIPKVYASGYDEGLELITGESSEDFRRLEEALHWLISQPRVALDYETNCLRPSHERDPLILTASLATFERGVAFSVDHPLGWGTETRQRRVRGLLGEFLLMSGRKIVHNFSFEAEWTHHYYGPRPLYLSDWACTQAQSYILDGRSGTNSLEVRTQLYFGFNLKEQSPVDPKQGILRYPLPQVLRYNGMDSKWAHLLDEVQMQELGAMGLEDVYEYRVSLGAPFAAMQAKGVPVDRGFAERYYDELGDRLTEVSRKARNTPEVRQYERRYGAFSPSNPDHVLTLLKEICKRDEVRREDHDGNVSYSSDEEVLSSLPVDQVPSAPLVLQCRQLEKIRGTYLHPIASGKVIAPWDGRVHCQYSPIRTATGRPACEDPNLQNIPTRTADGRKVREAFVAEPGGLIAAFDYGQIEARVIGMASQDQTLMRYQWTNYDIHGDWATRIVAKYGKIKDHIVKTFNIDWDEKGHKTLRQEAKNKWVFPMFFGARPDSCARDLHLPEDVAQQMSDEFWDEFPGVLRWQEGLMTFYEKHLYVETLDGFRRRGKMTKNEIINLPIQGTAARIVTAAQVALSEMAFLEDDPELQPNLNIHDDLSFWLTDGPGMTERISRIATEMCRHRFDFISVPLVVEVKVGERWNAMEEVAVYRSDELFNLENPFK